MGQKTKGVQQTEWTRGGKRRSGKAGQFVFRQGKKGEHCVARVAKKVQAGRAAGRQGRLCEGRRPPSSSASLPGAVNLQQRVLLAGGRNASGKTVKHKHSSLYRLSYMTLKAAYGPGTTVRCSTLRCRFRVRSSWCGGLPHRRRRR